MQNSLSKNYILLLLRSYQYDENNVRDLINCKIDIIKVTMFKFSQEALKEYNN